MKTWLAGASLLICSSAMAQTSSEVCRLKIGEDWVPMGASVFRSCLKYAESAATPGERQYAEFGGISFYFIDGKFAQSTDGGKTWEAFRLDDNQAQIGSLNVLRESPQPDGAKEEAPRKRKKSKPAEPISTETAVVVESPAFVAEEPSVEQPSMVAEAGPLIRRSAAASTSPGMVVGETTQPSPPPAQRAPSRRTSAAAATVPLKDCQINTGKSWQNVVSPSLAACGQLLAKRMKNYPTTRGHAYWGGQFLLYYDGLLYLSADGQNWSRTQ